MGNLIFMDYARVEVQGDLALYYIGREKYFASYEIVGFNYPSIVINDYRLRGISALDYVLKTGDLSQFAEQFNHPALIKMYSDDIGSKLIIDLMETELAEPDFVLWAAIGITETVPAYSYLLYQIAEIEPGLFAFFCVYRRTTNVNLDFAELDHFLPVFEWS